MSYSKDFILSAKKKLCVYTKNCAVFQQQMRKKSSFKRKDAIGNAK